MVQGALFIGHKARDPQVVVVSEYYQEGSSFGLCCFVLVISSSVTEGSIFELMRRTRTFIFHGNVNICASACITKIHIAKHVMNILFHCIQL